MSTITHGPPDTLREKRNWALLLIPEVWASLAISVMWLAVLFTAIWGPAIVNNDAGGNSETIPTVVPVAIFAFLGTLGRGQARVPAQPGLIRKTPERSASARPPRSSLRHVAATGDQRAGGH